MRFKLPPISHLLWLLLLLGLVSCTSATSQPSSAVPVYTEVESGTLRPGEAIPPPTGPVVLTLSGKIGQTNFADTLQFDMDTLERLGLVAYSINDDQALGHTVEFHGVLLSQLLAVAQADADASHLKALALNDYLVEIPLSDVEKFPVLLATAADGERMPVERYGPTRIIYPTHAFTFDDTIYDARWIWQLKSLEVQ